MITKLDDAPHSSSGFPLSSRERGTGGEVRSPWPFVPLGEVLSHYQQYIDQPEPRAYPKLSVKLYGKGVVLDSPADGTSLKMQRHQLAKPGQVILSEIWGKKGAIGIVPLEGDGALCTSHFFLFDVRKDRLDRNWLQAIFTANYLQDQLDAEARGTTGYAAVRPTMLLQARIPLPPLAEQRRIVTRIEALAGRIAEARHLRQEALAEAEALWRSVQRVSFVLDEVRGSRQLSIEECCQDIIDYRGRTPPISDAGIPHITSANIRQGGVDWNTNKFVSEETYERYMTRGLPQVGDVIFTMEAPLGEAAIVIDDRRFSLAQRTLLLRSKSGLVDPNYLAWVLTSPIVRERVYAQATGTTVKGIASKRLKLIPLPVPPLEQQLQIVRHLDKLNMRRHLLKRHQAETAAELNALLPAVLDRAFRGEL